MEDITKCKDKRDFLQHIVDSMSDTIMAVDLQGTIIFSDQSIKEKIKKANLADVNNPKCYEVYHNRTSFCTTEDHPCPLQDVLKTKEKTTVLQKFFLDDGTTQYLEMVASPIYDENKKIIGIAESTRDVTSHLLLLEKLKNKTDTLATKVNQDGLTALPNRTLFMDRLKQGIAMCQREDKSLAVLFIDLDNFKYINDTYGHKVGDSVLKEVAQNILSLMRAQDTFARLGGDEFTIIFHEDNSKKHIEIFAGKIIAALNKKILIDSHEISVSCSIGISMYKDGSDSEKILHEADMAMYKAKHNGKNSFALFDYS